MSYYMYLVETKKEYTIHLINILTPHMYQGIQSIYDEVKNNVSDNDELKLFQSLLRKIPLWSDYIINKETSRILKDAEKGDIIEDLIKAVIKSNIMILTNTPPEKKDKLRIKHDITISRFIHNSYIEIARNIFQNPYLFYNKYTSYELKKNQREANEIIKQSIEQAIRKILPMNIILQNYTGNSFQNNSDDFHHSIPDADYSKLKCLLNNDKIKKEKKIDDSVYKLVKSDNNLDDFINVKIDNTLNNNISDNIIKNNISISNNINNVVDNKKDDIDDEDISASYYKQIDKKNIEIVYDNKKNDNKKPYIKSSEITCCNSDNFDNIINDVSAFNIFQKKI